MKKKTAADFGLPGWDRLRHSGLLFDAKRAAELRKSFRPPRLLDFREARLRTLGDRVLDAGADAPRAAETSDFVTFVLTKVCGFSADTGKWQRGSSVPKCQGRQALTGRVVKPRQLWNGRNGARLPVFFGEDPRLGIGRSRRFVSEVVEWLRAGDDRLALLTNGRQWRLLFAGLDYEASCEWDLDSWFEEGGLAPQVETLRTLLSPELWTPEAKGTDPPLLRAIRDTRKGQADISEVLGEQVRKAVEILIQRHGQALSAQGDSLVPADIYRAACRVAMRLVVILYAEARELLPRGNARYDAAYGLGSLHESLERGKAARRGITESRAAWPRVLSLFSLVRDGSAHPDLPVKDYGGDLFAPGSADAKDGVSRALFLFENACFDQESHFYDADVHEMLASLARTEIVLPQGGCVSAPVDFSDLSSEYIGVLYEGLLDYELKTAPADDPVVFLSVGSEPALPLSRLEAMEDATLKSLFEKLKKGSAETEADEDETGGVATEGAGEPDAEPGDGADQEATEETEGEPLPPAPSDEYRVRADRWAQHAVEAASLTPKDKLVERVVRPGDWYLVRWGGTRKGSGSFYTRPGLAVPTTQRTLRPLAYDPPSKNGSPDRDAAPNEWTPKRPENILAITVCDPACGSGTFPLAALRFLTDALYASLHHHGRIEPDGERSLVRLLGIAANREAEKDRGGEELIPCRPDEDRFEPRLKAVLRRYVVERCIYAVDLDPLAVELCRLSLWIETMDRELPFGFLDHKIKCGNALIGAWFDQFRHYPAMAWKNRQGGDENHTNGTREKGARTKAIKAFVRERLKPAFQEFLMGRTVFREEDQLAKVAKAHDGAQATLQALHSLSVRDPVALAERYRTEFLGSSDWCSLKVAMDQWCACWFWPADELDFAPLPTNFTDPSTETQRIAERVTAEMRFFHWELEFPDVFREEGSGFSAVLGNPPWEIAKPNSKEFFSDLDPLYRSYGKQEALKKQRTYFKSGRTEGRWLNYRAGFRARSNFISHASHPFGDPDGAEKLSQRFTIARGKIGLELHDRWREVRKDSIGYSDGRHPFRHQGSADLNLYKLFLEAAHNLLRPHGRLGFLVPSGIYSDHGTRDLRDLFFERCRWEWLFSIENRRRIFPIHRNYKVSPVIVEKGSSTEVIRTAFMRHDIGDWERAEEIVISQGRDQLRKFSPNSRALLEIQTDRDLEILEKIYENSVLLGDNAPDGWGIRYYREFDMTGDSKLFPPRPEWEKKGYRPDEYSRWLLGKWRPIEDLSRELGVDGSLPELPAIRLESWLFDTAADLGHRESATRFAHGHLLRPGDVARTDWGLRCAPCPYDALPVSRTRLPPGWLLSSTGDAYVREDEVDEVAVPLYEGRMIGQFDVSQKGWVSGKARRAVWENISWDRKHVRPQYLMESQTSQVGGARGEKVAVMDVACSTVERTAIAAPLRMVPCGNSIGVLRVPIHRTVLLGGVLNSFAYDFCMRVRLSGLHANLFVLEETPLPKPGVWAFVGVLPSLTRLSPKGLCSSLMSFATDAVALTEHERLRLRCIVESIMFVAFGLDVNDAYEILRQCDLPTSRLVTARSEGRLDPKGFWRTDQNRDPELRLTVLTLVAFRDLQRKIETAGGNQRRGIEDFLSQNHGEGWLLPETLRLTDYGLGHDDRAREHQPVASRLGPRFYDWQLVQTPEERQQETHLHARNLLGDKDYGELLASRITDDASDDGDFAPLLAGLANHLDDDYRRRLLGETGAAALIAGLCAPEGLLRRSWPDFLNAVEAAGHLDDAARNRVLDRLRERNLLTDDEHEHYFVGGFVLPDTATDLMAAEPTPKYEPRPKNPSQPKKLFG